MNKYSSILAFLILIGITNLRLVAQQYNLYTQYAFNPLVINPAYAGSLETLSMTAFARKQWVGIDGAPTTATFSAHAPIKNQKMGLGLILGNDRIAIFNQTALTGIYSYRIQFSETKKLAMGLQAGFTNYSARYSQLTSYVSNDPALGTADVNSFAPNFGFGLYYSTNKFYAGLSIPYLSSNLIKSRKVVNNLSLTNIYFLATGYVFTLSKDFKFKPNLLVRYIPNSSLQADFNFNFLFRNLIWVGASYRTFNAVSFITQINVSQQLRFGYGYEINMGTIQRLSTGSHEFMINYLFLFSKRKVVNPRYF